MNSEEFRMMPIGALKSASKRSLVGGPFGSKLGRQDYVDFGVPVIRGGNLPTGQVFSFDDFVFVSEAKADELSSNLAYPGDVVVTQRGTLGQVGLIPADSPFPRFVISQSQMKLTVDESIASARYVYYALSAPNSVERLLNHALVAGVPHINLGIFSEFEIPVPSLETQVKIAAMLSHYDELIENNSRRIEILEEMAQAIYREWFVEFRYPGHEDVPLVESELGPIPEGWEVRSLPEVAEVAYGKNLPTKELNPDGRYPVYGAAKVIGRHSEKNVDERTIIMGCRGSCGAVAITESEAFVTNNSFTLKTRGESRQYLYWLLRLRGVSEFVTGTAQPQITLTNLNQLRLLHPPVNLLDQFCSVAELNSDLIFSLNQAIDVLQETRDLLLPRLISGEIDVSDLDIELAGSTL